MNLFEELKRRNVLRVVVLYIVVGWLLMQVADVLFPAMELPNWTIRLVFAMLLIGFPAAIIFSWAFEITPEGVKREKDVDRSKSVTHHTGRKLDYITIGVVIAAGVLAFADRLTREPEVVAGPAAQAETAQPVETSSGRPESSETSIAVLPFVNMSDDESNEYFSDGISEELLNLLVRVEGLRVPSRTSSFAFKGTTTDIPTIAEKLEVDHVLEGSVRKAGNTVRITAQLIDVSDDRHLWSETYDRDLEDIFAVQDEIATAIVEALKGLLGTAQAAPVEHRPPTDNVEAYELYLRGRHLWRQRGEDNLRKAIEYFEQALVLDPNFARGLAALATSNQLIPVYAPVDPGPWWVRSREAAEKALNLDPNLGEAHASIAALHERRGEWKQADEAFHRAMEADPHDVTATQWYAEFLTGVGRFRQSKQFILKALELDPLAPVVHQSVAYVYVLTGEMEESKQALEDAKELGFSGATTYIIPAITHLIRGDYQETLDVLEAGVAAGHENLEGDVTAMRAVLDPTLWPAERERLEPLPDGQAHQGFSTVTYYQLMGMTDEVFERLERSLETGEVWWPDYFWSAAADIRKDPRFVSAMERAGLIDYWREYGWPEFCSETDDKVSCQ